MKVTLNEKDAPLYKKLFVSAHDIDYARACASHVLKKGWHYQPWEKRGSIYFQQSVYMTAMVVSYARAFNRSDGMSRLPTDLVSYSAADKQLHNQLLRPRREVYAHSDGESYSVEPWHLAKEVFTDIVSQPTLMLNATETERFLAMTGPLLTAIWGRIEQMRLRGNRSPTL
jgi:hypothetical protein